MNVSDSLSAARFTAALSSLRAANKQPQLALELLVKSLEGLQVAGAAQSPSQDAAMIDPASGTGQIIDILA
jgi:hypothetical protein